MPAAFLTWKRHGHIPFKKFVIIIIQFPSKKPIAQYNIKMLWKGYIFPKAIWQRDWLAPTHPGYETREKLGYGIQKFQAENAPEPFQMKNLRGISQIESLNGTLLMKDATDIFEWKCSWHFLFETFLHIILKSSKRTTWYSMDSIKACTFKIVWYADCLAQIYPW